MRPFDVAGQATGFVGATRMASANAHATKEPAAESKRGQETAGPSFAEKQKPEALKARFRYWFKIYRERAGLTLTQLAERSNIPEQTVTRYSLGRPAISVDNLAALVTALGLNDPDDLWAPIPADQLVEQAKRLSSWQVETIALCLEMVQSPDGQTLRRIVEMHREIKHTQTLP